MYDFTKTVVAELASKGLEAELLREDYSSAHFGYSSAVFRFGSMFLKFSRDRSVEMLEITPVSAPHRDYWFGDVEVAMGWMSAESVASMGNMEPLASVISRLAKHNAELNDAFSGNLHKFDQAQQERAK